MKLSRAPLRIPRALAIAWTVLALAAGAHVLGGGELPAPPVIAALAALATLTAAPLTAGTMTVPVLAGYLLAGQFALHHAFSALSGPAVSGTGSAAHVHAGQRLSFAGPGVSPRVIHDSDSDVPMLGVHLLATLATALLLARAEASLWMLAAWLRILISPPAPGVMPPMLRPAVMRGGRCMRLGNAPGRVPARGPPRRTADHAAFPAIFRTTQNCRPHHEPDSKTTHPA